MAEKILSCSEVRELCKLVEHNHPELSVIWEQKQNMEPLTFIDSKEKKRLLDYFFS